MSLKQPNKQGLAGMIYSLIMGSLSILHDDPLDTVCRVKRRSDELRTPRLTPRLILQFSDQMSFPGVFFLEKNTPVYLSSFSLASSSKLHKEGAS
ncbi:hypothetical protein THAOC_09538 [Thalassiosira oceanica]|uniref:Uncharacterized protein n=1 Tax=Thalassiosira oceanica TaxID=159749 RepID=K0TFE3_THAOC|nr:hypothetical protein THAOC_09538 [Thalassiosira oceanica]|eukprot:EJK69222.1 hypothetical protein THAOC_09538 [Thalassiosira oceanica]